MRENTWKPAVMVGLEKTRLRFFVANCAPASKQRSSSSTTNQSRNLNRQPKAVSRLGRIE
jgi:hypothetical protein